MLFQKNILKKYLATLDNNAVENAWNLFKAYFLNPDIQQNIRQSKEEQFQEGFLRELFVKVLGYTLNPTPNYNLITEQKNESNSKKADGAIIINGNVVGVIELKDHKTTDLGKIENQAFGYKSQNKNARYIIISNFEKLRLYIDNAVDYEEFNLFVLSFADFRTLYLALNYKSVESNTAVKMKDDSLSNEEQITNLLYKDYSEFKRVLYEDICTNWGADGSSASDCKNVARNISTVDLYKKTQKLLDRFLFIFFAEDCGLLPPNTMIKIIDDWKKLAELDAYVPLYDRIKKYFNYLDTGYKGKDFEIFAYNGGLFKPDEVLDNLRISDEILEKYTSRLSEYDYESEVDVNILGHIFENSLNDMEGRDIAGNVSTTNKRKKDGVFYTPQYITKYIVENTVGKLCNEQKNTLGINEDEYFSDAKRKKETKILLLEKLDKYRKWLLGITILDPACGSGAFLNAALKFLMSEHHLIDEMEAKITGASMVMPNIENSILENNLYGVDINEESVEIAKLSLWLRTAKPHRKLNSLNNNIKCGNSLISDPEIAGEKAFDWKKEFPQVFVNGGFDVVIGNPPYLRVQGLRENFQSESSFYEHNYLSATGRFDIYILFMEKGFSLLNQNGILSYILPHKFLNADFGSGIRNFIYNNKALQYLVSFGSEQVFSDASVYTCIIGLSHNNKSFNFVNIKPTKLDDVANEYTEISNDNLADNTRWSFQSCKESNIIDKLNKQPLRFKDITKACSQGTVSMGDEIYILSGDIKGDYFIGFSEQTKQSVQLEKEIMKPILKGEDIKRFAPLKNLYWEIYPHHLVNHKTIPYEENEMKERFPLTYEYLLPFKQELVDKKIKYKTNPKYWYTLHRSREITMFEQPKIITAEISYGCNMTYDNNKLYHNTKCYTILFGDSFQKYAMAYLAIFNSKVMWFFLSQTGYTLRGGFFCFKTKYLEPFPVPDLSVQGNENYATELTSFVDKMLFLHKTLQDKKLRFYHRLETNFSDIRLTSTLQNFEAIEFMDFIAEFKKQKQKLSLSEQDEWEDYFKKYKTECLSIKKDIEATDAEIDRMVYELYGLSDEEIKTITNV
ncbi:MAG: Eco57I restriction-modification methylase domain-containing protein [Bacteroidales bacterium]|nr:Eco57I restriction-modification methylase domain-containing protein [Bacteroidales bacterium]